MAKIQKIAKEEVRLKGACGTMKSTDSVKFFVGWDKQTGMVESTGIVLDKHVPDFPRVIMGRETMIGDLGGVNFTNTEDGEAQITFARWPNYTGTYIGHEDKQQQHDIHHITLIFNSKTFVITNKKRKH